jgi:hypothetical protein
MEIGVAIQASDAKTLLTELAILCLVEPLLRKKV